MARLGATGFLPRPFQFVLIPIGGCQLFSGDDQGLEALGRVIAYWRDALDALPNRAAVTRRLARRAHAYGPELSWANELLERRLVRRLIQAVRTFNALQPNRLPICFDAGTREGPFNKYGAGPSSLLTMRAVFPDGLSELTWLEAEWLCQLVATRVADRDRARAAAPRVEGPDRVAKAPIRIRHSRGRDQALDRPLGGVGDALEQADVGVQQGVGQAGRETTGAIGDAGDHAVGSDRRAHDEVARQLPWRHLLPRRGPALASGAPRPFDVGEERDREQLVVALERAGTEGIDRLGERIVLVLLGGAHDLRGGPQRVRESLGGVDPKRQDEEDSRASRSSAGPRARRGPPSRW